MKPIEKHNMIMHAYTDGSAKPQNGYIGFGVHGYIANMDKVKNNGLVVSGHMVTDLGYMERSKVSLYRANPVTISEFFEIVGYSGLDGTNNVAELLSVYHILNHIDTNKVEVDTVNIYSDSSYAIGVVNKLYNDMDNVNTTLANVTVNKEYWILIYSALSRIECTVNIEHVKAHAANVGNIMADKLAYIGRLESEKMDRSKTKNDIEGCIIFNTWKGNHYWKYNTNRPLHAWMNTVYMLSDIVDRKILPYMVYEDNLEVGKPENTSAYGIVVLENECPTVNTIIDSFNVIQNGVQKPFMLNMGTIYDSTIKRLMDTYGSTVLLKDSGKRRNVLTVVKQPEDFISSEIAEEIFPVGVSRIAADNVDILAYAMRDIEEHVEDTDESKLVDITDIIYDIKPNKKGGMDYSLKDREALIKSKCIKLKVNVNGTNHKIILHLGTDIPPIVQLNKFGKHEPMVQVYHRIYKGKMIETFVYFNMPGVMKLVSVNLYSRYKFI